MTLFRGILYKIISVALDLESVLLKRVSIQVFYEVLPGRVRRFPYWRSGHVELASKAVGENQLAFAYASVQAALILGPFDSRLGYKARQILAKCYLAAGKGEEALTVLLRLEKEVPASSEIQEDIAASYMALNQNEKALAILSGINAAKLSAEAKAAYKFLQAKVSGRLNPSGDVGR